jgi:hypothetical protein
VHQFAALMHFCKAPMDLAIEGGCGTSLSPNSPTRVGAEVHNGLPMARRPVMDVVWCVLSILTLSLKNIK